MQQAVVLDVETTGLVDPVPIELVQKAPIPWGEHLSESIELVGCRYKNTKPIEPGAMAVHRIIPADLEGYEPWPGWRKPLGVEYLIGHHVDSDWAAIGKPDIKLIDTLSIAKHLWDGLGTYRLTALIFHLYEPAYARQITEKAHEASQDVLLTCLLLDHLLYEIPQVTDFEALWQFSEQARIPLRIGFSKYGPKNGQPGTLYAEVPTGMLKWIIDERRVAEMDEWEVKATRRELHRRGEL